MSAGNESPGAAQIGAPRVQQPRSLAHVTAPSHCPDGPYGACCCGHLALVHHILALASVPGEVLLVRPTRDYRPDLHDSGYRPAFFLLAAPPRAPPSPPVTV
jgi:hypothetical protein